MATNDKTTNISELTFPWMSNPNPNPAERSAQHALQIILQFFVVFFRALKDEVLTVYFPCLGLVDEMKPKTRTKEGDMEYQTGLDTPEGQRWHILLRVINGALYNNLHQLDCYAHDGKMYAKNMRKAKPIGYRSKQAKANLQALVDTLTSEDDKKKLLYTIRLFSKNLQACYTAAEWRNVMPITQEMYDAGLTSIINDWENEESGWTVTSLNVGDVLVITDKGMYCIRQDEFCQTHSTFGK